ncbi:MAG: Ig-like domain-containing protein, partial [Acidobacteriota bacterium]
MRNLGSSVFLAASLLVSLAGCGKETVGVTPPSVVSTTPINGATGIPVTQVVSATFSVAMNPATITSTTFTLTGPGGTTIAGAVAYNATNSVASFTPAVALAYNTLYTGTITTAVTDTLGDEPSGSTTWSFTTATQPTVLSTTPVNGATAVPITQVLTATFTAGVMRARRTP